MDNSLFSSLAHPLAKAAGMSLRQYIIIEHGGNFTLDKLERIAVALDCPPASLLP